MRRIGLAGVLALALSGVTWGAPSPAPTATRNALPLRSGGPTLIVGVGARIESVDPESGGVIGSIAPITVANFTWQRFLRRGKFLLAEGRTEWVKEPVWHSTRGLVLLDETGRVRWTETHGVSLNRASRAVFLDEDGNVAFDRIDKPMLIKPDGARIEIGAPPAGPVVHGPPDVLPVRSLCSQRVEGWVYAIRGGSLDAPPKDIARRLLVKPTLDERQIALVQVVDVAPEDEVHTPEVKTVAHMPLPQACRGALQWVSPTMSSRHWILDCAPEWEDAKPRRPRALFVIDVEARRLRRLTPPPSEQSDAPRDARDPDEIDATVMADGTVLATVWSYCTTNVYLSTPAGGWKRSNVATPFGPPFAPKLVCGRLTLQPTPMPGSGGCSGSNRQGPATFVRRPDGSWLTLPYAIAAYQSGSCSSDAEVAAFVADGALTTARLDRDERKIVRTGVAKELPLAWLP